MRCRDDRLNSPKYDSNVYQDVLAQHRRQHEAPGNCWDNAVARKVLRDAGIR